MRILVKTSGTGFQRIRPDKHDYGESIAQQVSAMSLTQAIQDSIQAKGPYHLFITLTFGRNTTYNKRCQFLNYFLHVYNQVIFTRDYRARDEFHQGYAIFEKHRSEALEDKPHVHMLLRPQERYFKHDFNWHHERFHAAARKVQDGQGRRVFHANCIDIQEVKDNGVIGYCFKNVRDNRIDHVKSIGKDGISDNI